MVFCEFFGRVFDWFMWNLFGLFVRLSMIVIVDCEW